MYRTALHTVVSLVVGILAASFAMADDAAIEAGRKIAVDGISLEKPACAACHLPNGAGQPDTGIPRLAGLTAGYIEAQLQYFASGARQSPVMEAYAAGLTASRRHAADYFASLPVPSTSDLLSATDAKLERGREIFLNGDFQTGALACAQCHGPTGLGVGDFSPRIAGQSAAYISWQLQNWRADGPRDPQGAFMQAEARRLSPSDADAV
jgi:cytochrome c553